MSALCLENISDNLYKRQIKPSFNSNTTRVTFGAGTDYPSGALEFISGFQWGSSFVLQTVLCLLSFGHCVSYPSSIYGFRLLHKWYLQTIRRLLVQSLVALFMANFFLCPLSLICHVTINSAVHIAVKEPSCMSYLRCLYQCSTHIDYMSNMACVL